jgi:hypothetical protein
VHTIIPADVEKRSNRGVAQFGRALRSGRRGRWFESSHLDFLVVVMPGNGLNKPFPGIFLPVVQKEYNEKQHKIMLNG